MLVYFAAISWCLIISYNCDKISNSIKFISLIPFVFFSAYRGNSGSDTENYYTRFQFIEKNFDNFLNFFNEPGLPLIMKGVHFVGGDYESFAFVYAIIFVLLYFTICCRFKEYKVFLLTVGVVFFIDGLTNTLRVSMCYLFFIIATTSNKTKHPLYFVSFLFHVSSLIMILLRFYLSKIKLKISPKMIVYILLGAILFFVFIYGQSFILENIPRLNDKMDAYSELKTRSFFSGLSDIYIIFCLSAVASFYNRDSYKQMAIDFLIILCICIGLFIATSISMGVLRLIKICVLTLCLLPPLTKPKRNIPKFVLFVILVPYLVNFFLVVSSGNPYGKPFI
ncbi:MULTISPECIES: EpsG family protein [unclassified Shewanella]|uniref:EpsG family protein n=1 Tax=unclassified Shewanella TaxID=196818 RepID=UPI00354BBDF1